MKGEAVQQRTGRGQGGFTMIELVVVIGILALLGGIATIAAQYITEDSGVEVCTVERSTIISAMAAAKSKPGVNTYDMYLTKEPRFFENTGTSAAPVWGPTAEHPGSGCQSTIPTV